MKSVTKAILSCDCVTFDTLLFCMTCLRIVGIMFHSVHETHVICKYVQSRRQIEGSSKYWSNRMGKDVCYLVYLCFQIPKRVQSKAVFVSLRIKIHLCVRPVCSSLGHFDQLILYVNSLIFALCLFYEISNVINILRLIGASLEVSLILTVRRDQTQQNAQ